MNKDFLLGCLKEEIKSAEEDKQKRLLEHNEKVYDIACQLADKLKIENKIKTT